MQPNAFDVNLIIQLSQQLCAKQYIYLAAAVKAFVAGVCVCVCSNCIKILLRTFNAAKKIVPNVPSAPITQKRAEEKVQLVQLVLSQHICHFAGDVKITRNHLKKLKSQLNS